MIVSEMPLFLTDKSWYTFDEKENKYQLTEQAPEEAKKSYKEFYELLERRFNGTKV